MYQIWKERKKERFSDSLKRSDFYFLIYKINCTLHLKNVFEWNEAICQHQEHIFPYTELALLGDYLSRDLVLVLIIVNIFPHTLVDEG